ncbi:HutD family protein [Fusobacterium sp.]|uniref:HutD family protein n=1 Tax=Fusobacterium sp. TaxID=68766 RepID=UPI00396C9159
MFKIIKENERVISNWSGGVTKQLYIYPENSEYSKRNFKFRISIATTEIEKSTFTKLENVNRVISILDGKMELEHIGHYNKTLNKYEIDRFHGEWDTHSQGKVTDFNLMIKNGNGDFFFKEINKDEVITLCDKDAFGFIFCIDGSLCIDENPVKKGEFFITDNKKAVIKNRGKIFYGYIEK